MSRPTTAQGPARAWVRIDGPNDPRLEPYRAVRERDLVGRQGLFVAEGRVVLEKAAAAAPERLESVLVAEARLAGLAGLLETLPGAVPVYVASQAAMDEVVGFPIHRGLLAIGRRAEWDAAQLLADLPERSLVIGLVGIANHDNMGGIFRNAAAFGVDAILLDDTCCDPLYRKAIRVSVGAALTVPFARAGDARALAALAHRASVEVAALSPHGEIELGDFEPSGRTMVLFGAEGPGLPNDVLERVQTVRISMAGGFDSLNVGTTSGIVLHNLRGKMVRP